jgi:hypothetical protein
MSTPTVNCFEVLAVQASTSWIKLSRSSSKLILICEERFPDLALLLELGMSLKSNNREHGAVVLVLYQDRT